MIGPLLGLGAASFVISLSLTWLMIRLAPRIGFVDKPGGRKIHENPKPLGGGVAIFWGIAIPMLALLVCLDFGGESLAWRFYHGPNIVPLIRGAQQQTYLTMCFLGAMC